MTEIDLAPDSIDAFRPIAWEITVAAVVTLLGTVLINRWLDTALVVTGCVLLCCPFILADSRDERPAWWTSVVVCLAAIAAATLHRLDPDANGTFWPVTILLLVGCLSAVWPFSNDRWRKRSPTVNLTTYLVVLVAARLILNYV